MFKSQTAKRFGAVMIAVAITLFTNYAISFAGKSASIDQSRSLLQTQSADRNGDPPPRPPPKP